MSASITVEEAQADLRDLISTASYWEIAMTIGSAAGGGSGPTPDGTRPGIGTKAVLPPHVALMGRPVAGKWPAIMKDGKVYVHRFHLEANKMANGGVMGSEDFYRMGGLDHAGIVISVSW